VQINTALDVSGDKAIKKNGMGKENQGKFLRKKAISLG